MKYISSLALIVALVPGLAMAATSNGTGDAKAKIVTPINVAENGDLNAIQELKNITGNKEVQQVNLSGSVALSQTQKEIESLLDE